MLSISGDFNFSPFSTYRFDIPKSKRECGRIVAEFIDPWNKKARNRIRLAAKRRLWKAVKTRKTQAFLLEPEWGRAVKIEW